MAINTINFDSESTEKNKRAKSRLKNWRGFFPYSQELSEDKIIEKIFLARVEKTDGICHHKGCKRKLIHYNRVNDKPAYRCNCGKRHYVLKDTPLSQCRVPLEIVAFILFILFTGSLSKADLEVTRWKLITQYKNMQRMLRRISTLMGNCIQERKFLPASTIEIDFVHLKVFDHIGVKSVLVFCMYERETGLIKAYHAKAENHTVVNDFLKMNGITMNHILMSDSSRAYNPLLEKYNFLRVNHSEGEYVRNEVREFINSQNNKFERVIHSIHSNSVEGFNRRVKATHRIHNTVTEKYLEYYLNRIAFNAVFCAIDPLQRFDELLKSLPPISNIDNSQSIKWKNAA